MLFLINDILCRVGARVMRTQDGAPAQRDFTFLTEAKISNKGVLDRKTMPQDTFLKATASIPADTPVSLYTQQRAVSSPQCCACNTFGRQTNFTKLMGDHSKVVLDE